MSTVTMTIEAPVAADELMAVLRHARTLSSTVNVTSSILGFVLVEVVDPVWPTADAGPDIFAIDAEMGDDGYAEPDPDLPKWTHQPDRPLLGLDRPLRCKDQPDGDAVTSAVAGFSSSSEGTKSEVEGPLDDEEQANARAAEDWSFLGRTDRADREAAAQAATVGGDNGTHGITADVTPEPAGDDQPAPGKHGPDTIAWDVLTLLADDMGGTWEGSIGDLADEVGRGSRASNGMVIRQLAEDGLLQIDRISPRKVRAVCLTRGGWDHLGRLPSVSAPGHPNGFAAPKADPDPEPAPAEDGDDGKRRNPLDGPRHLPDRGHSGFRVIEVIEEADVDVPQRTAVERARAAAEDAAW